ncbi:cyclopropane-fatty-acyl-phospholipid synthase [Halanaerobium saccharolyticum]|uniref:Cyclopropane-fatty-acyl-phospholipid synthase n=1 Tax=Halanaerobium saccharolyticum TaxID=43595 RepID=A0A4R7YZ53_9FIRM|nr:cyclopropane-fatty-acyl-phospholipid synthase family protein [Halanaerobium saccharolyticum]RAK08444.1 cyclopropane-fatty-acyl-phospholipid synthase [Halanaerobium saccharolyticum]TDW03521.1 cyclopropane-fatty-acyl-phospholipid synthase [Halanaerobium saccharolyticum]TDX59936.1 cyclopropane-fatty-acyl-phospholipid synthase [Halanaerobium saccharolyticum]
MLTKKILDAVFKRVDGQKFEIEYWDGETKVFNQQLQSEPAFKIIFSEKLSLNEIRKSPQLKMAEAYMDGKINFEGSIKKLIETAGDNVFELKEEVEQYKIDQVLDFQTSDSPAEEEAGVRKHYDIGNDFFKLWQDDTMTYSCAYFRNEDDDLKDAQLQKIDHVLKKVNLKEGERLLDIGCGWGSLALRAAEKYGVDVMGITLSKEQEIEAKRRAAEAGLADKIEIRRQDYRDLAEENLQFDKIVSVGMFEHVGKDNIPIYFGAIDKLLKNEGLSLVHSITHLKEQPAHPWLQKYIFPWGYIPSAREIIWELPENNFHLLDAEDIGYHYSLTAERWLDNYEKVSEQVKEKFDEHFYRMWRTFLMGVVFTFRYASTSVHQILFSKGKNTELPLTRNYIYQDQ